MLNYQVYVPPTNWFDLTQLTAWKVCKYGFFFWSVFSCVQTEYEYFRTQENTDQRKLLIWTLFTQWLSLSVFPVTFLSTLPHKTQVYNFFQTQQSPTCNRPSLPPKMLKSLNAPIHLSSHFSLQHHKNLSKLGILIYLQDQYLSATHNVNLSPTQSPNIKILFKCDMSIRSQTRITAVGDRDFTNTLQD